MILVLLGTQNNSFIRLLKEVEKCINKGIIKEEVIAQIGNTKYDTEKMIIKEFCSQQEISELIDEASFIITHGGVGSIIDSIKKGKKVIAIPRLKKYKEHVNDHQTQIIESLSESGFIIGANDVSELEEKIKLIDKFEPNKFISNTDNMISKIEGYIDNN